MRKGVRKAKRSARISWLAQRASRAAPILFTAAAGRPTAAGYPHSRHPTGRVKQLAAVPHTPAAVGLQRPTCITDSHTASVLRRWHSPQKPNSTCRQAGRLFSSQPLHSLQANSLAATLAAVADQHSSATQPAQHSRSTKQQRRSTEAAQQAAARPHPDPHLP